MNSTHNCRVCGADLTPSSMGSLCPACLFNAADSAATSNPATDSTVHSHDTLAARPPHPGANEPGIHQSVHYFGDYEILAEIARGGMGVVYRARQVSLNRLVAIKMILGGQLASPRDVRRFKLEAEAAGSLQHPNIVAIHEVGEHNGLHYFSMDLVEGEDLSKLLKRTPLEPDQVADLARQLADAVGFAHRHGILHRDLKPSNVLIDKDGKPRITDFGLAKRQTGASGATMSGAVLGTPSYMAPEQAEGRLEEIDRRTDVFGLGAILYEMLTGRAPFVGESPVAVMRRVVEENPEHPTRLNPSAPRALEAICLKCLQKNPQNRYQSATDLREDLDRFLRRERVLARPPARAMAWLEWVRRNPWLPMFAGGFAAIGLCVGLVTLWEYSKLLLWKGANPGQRPPTQHLLEILGFTGGVAEHLGVLLFPYMLVAPAALVAVFAAAKVRAKLTPNRLLGFALLGTINLVLAVGGWMMAAKIIVWNQEPFMGILGAGLVFVPALYFSFHLGWLLLREVKVWHFGEREADAKAVYGESTPKPPEPRGFNRTYSNLGACVSIAASLTLLQYSIMPGLMFVAGMAMWGAATAYLVLNGKTVLRNIMRSGINRSLGAFVGVFGLLLYFSYPASVVGILRNWPEDRTFAAFAILGAPAFGAWVYWKVRQAQNEPREIHLSEESNYGNWCKTRWGGSIGLAAVIAMWSVTGIFGFPAMFLWGFAITLPSTLLELLRANAANRRRGLITLGLGSAAGAVSSQCLPHQVSWPLFVVGALVGSLNGLAHTATLPPAFLGRRAVFSTSLALALITFSASCSVANAVRKWPAQIKTFNQLFQQSEMEISLMLQMKQLYATPVRKLVRLYTELGFLDEAVRRLDRLAAHPRITPHAWFTARTLQMPLLAALGESNRVKTLNTSIHSRFASVKGRFFQVGWPNPQAVNPIDSRLRDNPHPEPDLLPPGFRPAALEPDSYDGMLNLWLQPHPVESSGSPSIDRPAARLAWIRVRVVADAADDIAIHTSSDDRIAIWWNGDAVLRKPFSRVFSLDQDLVHAKLRTGTNEFLAATQAVGDDWCFMLRITRHDGTPLRATYVDPAY